MAENRISDSFEREVIRLLKDGRIDWKGNRPMGLTESQLSKLIEEEAANWGQKNE
jgi:hypothetical protein